MSRQSKKHQRQASHGRATLVLMGLLCLLLWQATACTEPPPLCSDEKPCPATFLCRDAVCICDAGAVRCGDVCVFLGQNAEHCGACGLQCSNSQACVQGSCVCDAPLRDCLGTCVDTARDIANCGQCGVSCRKGETCINGLCNNGCPDNIPNKCGSICTDTTRDELHCGTCGNKCERGLRCIAGKCQCPVDAILCGGKCTEVLSDSANCGKCGSACQTGEVCASGRCLLDCPGSTPSNCFGGCVDVKTNTTHCGGCGKACFLGQICRDGRCACLPRETLCGSTCVDLRTTHAQCGGCQRKCARGLLCAQGRCASNCPEVTPDACFGGCFDMKSDRRHCGKCGNTCQGLQVCQKGVCNCPPDYITCEGKCVDPKTHPLHCGGCGKVCTAGESCGDGKCDTTCPTGTPKVCFGGCFDTKTDDRHCNSCGYSCLGGARCEGSRCVCTKPLQACEGLCLDLQTDQLHCGACGRTCPAGERCAAGKCILDCDAKTACGNVCVDTQTDSKHCGQCDNRCKGDSLCTKGACSCGAGRGICGDSCASLQSDERHCGKCDNACATGEVCDKGKCVTLCVDTKLSACNGACFNLTESILHCGTCGNTCATGQSCVAGKCTCPTGQVLCAGQCVDLQVNLSHCGECAKACQAGQFCQAGACTTCNAAAPVTCGSTCCLTGETCCDNKTCADFQKDANNCGGCGKACAAGLVCDKGKCTKCADGQTRPCYTGPAGTRGVGECQDGKETCLSATWGACLGTIGPATDSCDDKDNNCDGNIDEVFTTKGNACTIGVGVCQATGKLVCNTAGDGVICDGKPGTPVVEVCDNFDNDCDGQVDEGLQGPPCTNQQGVCKGAKRSCDKGVFVACKAADFGTDYEAKETKCDGKDNNCDGTVDENLLRAGPLCANQVGFCNLSQKSCVSGVWANCTAREFGVSYKAPQTKETLCDGVDNDCDGNVDEGCVACLPTKLVQTLTHTQAARWLDFSPDGTEVAAGAFLGKLRIWTVATGALRHTITTPAGPLGIQYNPFLAELGVSQADFSFYNPANAMPIRSLQSHLPVQHHLAFHPSGRQAMTIGADKKALVWDLKTYKTTRTITLPAVPDAVAWGANGTLIAVGMKNNEIYLAPPVGGTPKTLKGHTAAVTSLAFSPNGKFLASTSGDKTLRLWNATTGVQVWSVTAAGALNGVAFSWDNNTIAVGQTIFLELRNASNGALAVPAIRAHGGGIADVSWSPDGRTIGTSSAVREIKLWQCP